MSAPSSDRKNALVATPARTIDRPLDRVLLALIVCAAYYLGALLGYTLKFPNHAPSALWPPNSILLAALLLTPNRAWLVVVAGAFPAHLLVQLESGVPISMSLLWFVSNLSETLIGAYCVRRLTNGELNFDSLKNVIIFITFAVFLAPFVSSFLDAAFVVAVGWKTDRYWQIWRMRFLSNLLADLTLVPVIVLWSDHGVKWLRRVLAEPAIEALLLISGLLPVTFFVFNHQTAGSGTETTLVYLPLPFLLWAAVRFRPLGVSSSLLVVVLMSIWGAMHGRGPFINDSPEKNVLSLQIFLIAISLPMMVLAALVEERREKATILGESEARFRTMADTAPVLIWMSGIDKLCTFVSKSWLDFTGRTLEQELGHGWAEGIHPEDRAGSLQTYVQAVEKRQEFTIEYRLRRHNGEYGWVLDKGLPRFSADGAFLGYVGSAFDITERKRAEARLNTQYAIARILSESTSIATAMTSLMQAICEGLEWDLGEVWEADAEGRLRCIDIWHLPSSDLAEFASASRQVTFVPGAGLPGRVWKTHQPAWVSDVERDRNLPRISLMRKAGLRSAFGFPVLTGDATLVIGFFSRTTRPPDEDLLHMMASIGSQMGQFHERTKAENALREAIAEVERLKERLEAENVYLRSEVSEVHRYAEMVGQSRPMQSVLRHVQQVAGTDTTVLVLGETGTGKELVARALHANSSRKNSPLVKVNCSALPGELIESELFGHEKGAFTGATARQTGRFELADGGTIFLDEIGDLPLKLQAKLLRVLQEGEFERVGSGKTIKVNVRVIAATNRNLAEVVQNGRFRADLYYRLNVYPIHLAPLRDRVEDLPLLTAIFIKEASRRLGRTFAEIPREVLSRFESYDWPGNVRELQNVIERAAVMSNGPVLRLPEEWNDVVRLEKPAASDNAVSTSDRIPKQTLNEVERDHIIQVLKQTGWRVEGPRGAAVRLGLKPNTLRSRMQKLGIRRPGVALPTESVH